jgi:Tol biopolymer transport system component
MPAVIRRALGVGVLAVLLAVAVEPAASSTSPPDGARLAIVRSIPNGSGGGEISVIDPQGADLQRLVAGTGNSSPSPRGGQPSWSPDGSRLAFLGAGRGAPRVFVVRADGRGLRGLRGARTENDPVFAPNGREVAFVRMKVFGGEFMSDGGSDEPLDVRTAIWTVDVDDGSLRRLTPWRERVWMAPSSYSSDGSTLAVTAYSPRRDLHALAVRLDGGGSIVLARRATNPVYSPDGSRVVFVRERWHEGRDEVVRNRRADLFTVQADGSGLARLTYTPKQLESSPSWDPSGERVAFTSSASSRPFQVAPAAGNRLMQINADGSCPTRILSAPNQVLWGVAWQPGPGRDAGRIDC